MGIRNVCQLTDSQETVPSGDSWGEGGYINIQTRALA